MPHAVLHPAPPENKQPRNEALRARAAAIEKRWHYLPSTPERRHILDITWPGEPLTANRGSILIPRVRPLVVTAIGTTPPDNESSFCVTLNFAVSTDRRVDADNLSKPAIDACTGVVWVDDVQVVELHVYVDRGSSTPRSSLAVSAVGTMEREGLCDFCGRPFLYNLRSSVTRRYCSQQCYKRTRHEACEIRCISCGKLAVIARRPERLEESSRGYCEPCRGTAVLTTTCAQCGAGITRYRSQITGKRTFCSYECHILYSRGRKRHDW